MAAPDRILSSLNPAQREAVTAIDGPCLVLAGAGSGKTRMLTHRIAHLISSGAARPHEILAVTFTNKAAREMRERVDRLLEERGARVWVSTFHSTCVRILRRDIGHLGYKSSFAIYDDSDSLAAIKRVLKALQLDERNHPPRAVRGEIDRTKSRGLLPSDLLRRESSGYSDIAPIYQRYQKELAAANALDFGDLILLTTRLFENHPGVLADYQHRWRYILVDEYQDTNPVQYRLLRQLSDGHRNLCVVGDEDQSIYRFREADIRNILDFEKDFPGAQVIRLEQNYRSTQAILDAATAVVSNNQARKGKRLFTERAGGEPVRFYEAADERAEAAYVVGEVLRLIEKGQRRSDMAIFYRTHAQSRPFEEELLKYNLPYAVVGGTRFYDRAEIKDALSYLRVLRNPDDTEGLLRIINTPVRGIGKATVDRMLALAQERGESLNAAARAALASGELGSAATKRVGAFFALLDGLRDETEGLTVPGVLGLVLERTGFWKMLTDDPSVEAEARRDNLAELVAAAEEFERQNREGLLELDESSADRSLVDLFLEQITLIAAADGLDDRADRLALLTAHVAKGLEFPIVFLVGMEEGVLPHYASLSDPAALEEERRLCYVGMTRAMERLYLTNATLRRMHGTARYNLPSRFLSEIPAALGVGRAERSRVPDWASSSRPPRADLGDWRPPRGAAPAEPKEPGGLRVDYSEGQWSFEESPALAKGTRVEHPVFGAGRIESVQGQGPAAKAQIRFDRAGVKTVVLRYAQLRILSR